MGSLTIVGTGMSFTAHITNDAHVAIRKATTLLYSAAEPLTAAWIRRENPRALSIDDLCPPSQTRRQTYADVVSTIMGFVREGDDLVVAYYGHPTTMVQATIDAASLAEQEGYPVTIMPAVSALDCLYADLAFDPGAAGSTVFEASDLVLRPVALDPSVPLIVGQIGLVGNPGYDDGPNEAALDLLVARLCETFGPDHECCLYEAAVFPVMEARMDWLPLGSIGRADLSARTTLFVPAASERAIDPAAIAAAGLDADPMRLDRGIWRRSRGSP